MKHPDPAIPAVSRETRERLDAYMALLARWSEKINLVADPRPEHVWDRHVVDALQLIPLIPDGTTRAIDLGSGAGFPGLVLAIATGIPFDLVESDQRKCAFLREAARITAAPAKIHACRIEAAPLEPAPLVTARALAALPELLSLSAKLVTPDGLLLFPKGRGVDAELTRAQAQWHMQVRRTASCTDPDAAILQIRDLRRVA